MVDIPDGRVSVSLAWAYLPAPFLAPVEKTQVTEDDGQEAFPL